MELIVSLVLVIVSVGCFLKSESVDKDYMDDSGFFWLLYSIAANFMVLFVSANLVVTPAYYLIIKVLPGHQSFLHTPVAVIITAIGCFVAIMALCGVTYAISVMVTAIRRRCN